MKGTIVKCLQDLVVSKGGAEAWRKTLLAAGKPEGQTYYTTAVVPDEEVLALFGGAAKALAVSQQQVMDGFGEYWSSIYAPGLYGAYFRAASNAKDFLLKMNDVHVVITKTAGASPPQFTFQDKGPKDLVMTYSSPRGLAALMPGLIRGVGTYYKERVTVTPSGNTMTIHFG